MPDDKVREQPPEDRSKLPKATQDEFAKRDSLVPKDAKAVAPPYPPPEPNAEMRRQKEEHDKGR